MKLSKSISVPGTSTYATHILATFIIELADHLVLILFPYFIDPKITAGNSQRDVLYIMPTTVEVFCHLKGEILHSDIVWRCSTK